MRDNAKLWLTWLTRRHALAGGITEVRALVKRPGPRAIWSGFYTPDQVDTLLDQISPVARVWNVLGEPPRAGECCFYTSLHAVSVAYPEGMTTGQLTRVETCPGDADVIEFGIFVVDIDPEREQGRPSSHDDRARALEVAHRIQAWFQDRGVAPVLGDSGNGYHLVIPLTPQEDVLTASRSARALLHLLKALFAVSGVVIDTTVFNPSRIWKLYGTPSIKGLATSDRPYHMASIGPELLNTPDVDLFGILRDDLESDFATSIKATSLPPRSHFATPPGGELRYSPKVTSLPPENHFATPPGDFATPPGDFATPPGDFATPPGADVVWVAAKDVCRASGVTLRAAQQALKAAYDTGTPWRGCSLVVSKVAGTAGRHDAYEVALSSLPREIQDRYVVLVAPELDAETISTLWARWRVAALARLDLHQVYGDVLTGRHTSRGWLQARDPWSPTGDTSPSAGVADGSGEHEKGTFHSFRDGASLSVFDYLVQVGRAADFSAAAHLVADLTGIPAPDLLAHRRATLEAIQRATQNNKGRIYPDTHHHTPAPVAQVQTAQVEVGAQATEGGGIVPQQNDSAVASIIDPGDWGPIPSRPYVKWDKNREEVNAFLERVADLLAETRTVFQYRGMAVTVIPGKGLQELTVNNVGGRINEHCEIRLQKWDQDRGCLVFAGNKLLSGDVAKAFLSSRVVLERLPKLQVYTQAPLFDREWSLIQPGYHAGMRVYYDGPTIVPHSGDLEKLPSVLSDFPFKAQSDMHGWMGALVTMLGMAHWWEGDHPFVVVNGNKPGVGKTRLAQVLSIIMQGSQAQAISIPDDEAEFEKRLAAAVQSTRIVLFDNVKGRAALSSASFEMMLTAKNPAFRKLGTQDWISCEQNDFMCFLTANMTMLSDDLRRRSLPIRLHYEGNIKERSYSHPRLLTTVEEWRDDLVREAAGYVCRWVEDGKPRSPRRVEHSIGDHWSRTVDSILWHWGHREFLGNYSASDEEFDPRFQILRDVADVHHDKSGTCAEWETFLIESRHTDVWGSRWKDMTPRGRQIVLGRILTEYSNRIFRQEGRSTGWQLIKSTYTEGMKPIYRFDEVDVDVY